MSFIKYFVLPFCIPIFIIISSCWKNHALIRDSVIVSVISILLYATTFVPGLAAIFERMQNIGRRARDDEPMSGRASVTLMRVLTILAIYIYAYLVFTGKFVAAK